jgi:HAMP domain-containing protein
MLKTINTKFIFFTTIFILLSVGIPTTFLIIQMRENFDQRSRIMLESTIDVVNNCLINAMRMGRTKHVQTILDNISRNESVDHIRLFKKDGRITYSSNHTENGRNIQTISPGHVNLDNINQNRITLIEEERVYSVTRPIINGKECQKCHGFDPIIAYLDVDTNLTQAERFFHTGSLHMIFLAIAVILILFLGFYYLFNFFINRPLSRFKKALDNVERGNLEVQLPAKKPDEIGTLESHFNNMVLNLKESKQKIDELHFEQLQRADKLVTLGELAAEMAHEINNPAGIVMSRADFIQMDLEKYPNLKKYNEDLDVITNQINKISKITGSILKYSKKLPKEFNPIGTSIYESG